MLTEKEVSQVQKTLAGGADRLGFVFQALADPTRLKIFRLFSERQEPKDLCVTDIANVLGVSVPAASYQLRIMEVVGLVERERMGKMICYKLKQEDPVVKGLTKIID